MSCRRGVPDRCSCLNSLAEKVRELWERCANAIKSINGINPDGANNFDILPGAGIQVNPRANGIEIVATGAAPEGVVESVNGILPDEDGNVQINTGLLTVNSEPPDADGEFSITAGSGIQINAGTNGIEIENTSQGAIYTGVSPIDIDASNEISLKDWSIHETNYTNLITNGVTNTDIMLVFVNAANNALKSISHAYIPKGTPSNASINIINPYTYTAEHHKITPFNIPHLTYISIESTGTSYSQSGSSIYQTLTIVDYGTGYLTVNKATSLDLTNSSVICYTRD